MPDSPALLLAREDYNRLTGEYADLLREYNEMLRGELARLQGEIARLQGGEILRGLDEEGEI